MKTDEEIKKLLDETLKPGDPDKEWLRKILSPANRLNTLTDTIKVQADTLDLLEPLAFNFVGHKKSQSQKRQKRLTWRGLTKSEIGRRNEKIIGAWEKSSLTLNGFAKKQAERHGLSVSRIKQILKILK